MFEPKECGKSQTHDTNDEEVTAKSFVLAAKSIVVGHDQGLGPSEAGDLPVGLNFKCQLRPGSYGLIEPSV